jgi:hypothetical protein
MADAQCPHTCPLQQSLFVVIKYHLHFQIKPMTKKALLQNIQTAFENVKLEDGVGIWEGQGIDDYADTQKMAELKAKDERAHWQNIPYQDLITCSSSLSFFDAKGMRFCLPQFLFFDLLADEIFDGTTNHSPDVLFTLGYKLDEPYQKSRFDIFDKPQIQAIIHFLEYKMAESTVLFEKYSANTDADKKGMYANDEYIELQRTLKAWQEKLKA